VPLDWFDRAFTELTTRELYSILSIREAIFVVEQQCRYLEADGLDPVARHLWAAEGDSVLAYLRILPAGDKFAEVGIGRVLVAPSARGTGLAREIMRRGLAAVGPVAVRIAAQAHLERFYGTLGFLRAGEPFVEDGIPHVEMLRPALAHD
jgi:ElaA protein